MFVIVASQLKGPKPEGIAKVFRGTNFSIALLHADLQLVPTSRRKKESGGYSGRSSRNSRTNLHHLRSRDRMAEDDKQLPPPVPSPI